MNQNIIIGILAAIVVVGGGYFLLQNMNGSPSGTQATTTVSTTQNTTDTTSNPDSTPPSASTPSPVTDQSVAPSNSTAIVTGKVTPNGSPTTYWYEYGQSTTLGNNTSEQAIGSGWSAIASPAYITGLQKNTLYYFRLSARNAYGTVNGTTYTFSTNNNPPQSATPPGVSTNAATDVARTSATLKAHVDAHASATTYWFEYGTSAGFGSVSTFQSGGNGNVSAPVSIGVSGLNPQTKYYFRINAQNQFGTVNGSTQSFTTPGPAAVAAPVVTTQVASQVAKTSATLNGTVNPYGTQTSYWFEYSTDTLGGSNTQTTTKHSAGAVTTTISVQANIHALSSGTTYYYRTVAQNNLGIVRGDQLSFTTN